MTGLELLREEMGKRGLNKAQQTSKVAAVVLDILSGDEGLRSRINENIADSEARLAQLQREIACSNNELHNIKQAIGGALGQKRHELERWECSLSEQEEYIKSLVGDIKNCETAEGRDAMRNAQIFIQGVDGYVQSAYDRTAYITALGAILTHGSYNNVRELKKINPKLFGE